MLMFFFLDIYIPINGKQNLKLHVHVFCFSWAHYLEVQDFFFFEKRSDFHTKGPSMYWKGKKYHIQEFRLF